MNETTPPSPDAMTTDETGVSAQVVESKNKPELKPLREPAVLTLPDWKGASASHWLTQWEHQHGLQRVTQHDWQRPLRGDWMMQLQETVLRHEHVHLLAHGLGAHLIDAWLRHTQQSKRVSSVVLIDPVDLNEPERQEVLFSWKAFSPQAWPMPLAVLWKERQPSVELARLLTQWGAQTLADAPVGGGVVGGWSLVHEYWTRMEAQKTATPQEA